MPTGIICYNDQLALSVLNVLRDLELIVPADISLVGFDDSYLAEAMEPKLTSIPHPKIEMGIAAAKWIVSAIENRNSDGIEHSTIYEPELIIRNSTATVKSMDEI
jgi:GntR family transcriptional regulator of arabinose operon